MLLAVVSSIVAAEWVELYPYEERWINYVAPATISRAGDIVTMLSLADRKERPSNDYGSVKFLIEYDCKKKQYRVLDTSYHSGNMGGGRENHEKNVRPYWKPVRRGDIFEAKWMVACGKGQQSDPRARKP
jgi:hypothetical protein